MTFFEERIQKEIDSDNAWRKKNAEEHGWEWPPDSEREKRLLERTVTNHTVGDFIRAVLSIDNEEDARQFFEGYLAYQTALGSKDAPLDVVRSNIGWCFGEGMAPERVAMWRNVCGAAHPIFGAMAVAPTPEEAFEAGRKRAKEEPWPT